MLEESSLQHELEIEEFGVKTLSDITLKLKNINMPVPHPVDSNRPLFFLLDFVHVLKTIRNNWLNQTYYNRTFTYPSFDNLSITNIATMEDVRLLFKSEQFASVKQAANC